MVLPSIKRVQKFIGSELKEERSIGEFQGIFICLWERRSSSNRRFGISSSICKAFWDDLLKNIVFYQVCTRTIQYWFYLLVSQSMYSSFFLSAISCLAFSRAVVIMSWLSISAALAPISSRQADSSRRLCWPHCWAAFLEIKIADLLNIFWYKTGLEFLDTNLIRNVIQIQTKYSS